MQDIFWVYLENIGFEHLKVITKKDLVVFDGIIIRRMEDNKTYRVAYMITCDIIFQFRKIELTLEGESKKELSLNLDKTGLWYDEKGMWHQELDGCHEPDINFTPLTNTLPINRLNLEIGETKQIKTAYIALPQMTISPVIQSYECLAKDENGAIYLYKNLTSNYEAELSVNAGSFVKEYPGLFKMI